MNSELLIIIIAQAFGIVSWLLLMYSYTKEDIDKLLYIQILVCLFDVISYLLLGADAGLLICLVELIKTILYYKTDKDNIIFIISAIFYVVVAVVTWNVWYSFLPILGSIIDSYGTSRDSKMANICSIVSNTLWTIYDILILSYIGALNDIVVVFCNIGVLAFGYSRIMHISKFRIVKYKYLSKKTVDKVYKLDLKNFGEDNTWDKNYQKEVYDKNPDSFFAIKYKHDLVGYINYLNIIEDEYERLKRVRKVPDTFGLDKIIKFKTNKKAFLLVETINVKKEYEKEETIELIKKKINSFIKIKQRQRVFIHGIIAYAISDFEKNVYETMGFNKIKEFDDNTVLYELEYDKIKKLV